jgi:hypothetical protein
MAAKIKSGMFRLIYKERKKKQHKFKSTLKTSILPQKKSKLSKNLISL